MKKPYDDFKVHTIEILLRIYQQCYMNIVDVHWNCAYSLNWENRTKETMRKYKQNRYTCEMVFGVCLLFYFIFHSFVSFKIDYIETGCDKYSVSFV